MIIGVYAVLSRVNRSFVTVFVNTMNSRVTGANSCTIKYFNGASVLYVFLTLDIRGVTDIRLISKPINAPVHELENTDSNTPLINLLKPSGFFTYHQV